MGRDIIPRPVNDTLTEEEERSARHQEGGPDDQTDVGQVIPNMNAL